MKVAFVGKGGSGKTTLASLFALRAAQTGAPVMALDADINQNLAAALGAHPDTTPPALPDHLDLLKDWLRGTNPRIPTTEAMTKTTPPGHGSRLLTLTENNPLYEATLREVVPGIRLALAGTFDQTDLGVSCYHAKTGTVELLLSHLIDTPGQYVVVDMTAGADAFASGLFTRFDLTVLVCEPTLRSVGVFHQYATHAHQFGVTLTAVGNKITDPDDDTFLREHLGDHLLTSLQRSPHIHAGDRGADRHITGLEPHNTTALDTLRTHLDHITKDWTRYQTDAITIHRRNAHTRTDTDLTHQIDPTYDLAACASRYAHSCV